MAQRERGHDDLEQPIRGIAAALQKLQLERAEPGIDEPGEVCEVGLPRGVGDLDPLPRLR
jgi:hypothetical protein